MAFFVEYFRTRVLTEIESWPADVLADYARIVELLIEHGPNLKLPYSRAFGDGLFELRFRGRSGIGWAFYCFLVGKRVSYFTPLSRSLSKHPTTKSSSPESD